MGEALVSALRGVVRGGVTDDRKTIEAYSRDASIFRVRPRVAAFPKDAEDVTALVRFVREHRRDDSTLSLTARSAGTDMSGGPLNESVIVDFTRSFNRILEVGEDFAVVEPGCPFRDFEKAIVSKGLMLPSYPASKRLCAVGGMVANNSGGEKTLTYGKTADYVQELSVVLADGEEHIIRALTLEELEEKCRSQGFEGECYRKLRELLEQNAERIRGAKPDVSKNSSGYALWDIWDGKRFDLTRLFVGSQGTLGLITRIRFRLVPKKRYHRMLVIFVEDLKPLPAMVETLLRFRPETLESYDDHTLKFALRYFPDLIRSMRTNPFALFLQFIPDAWLVLRRALREGLPKLTILAEFTGDDLIEVQKRIDAAEAELEKFHRPMREADSEADTAKYWTIRRESFNLLRHHVQGKHTAPFIDDIIVRPSKLAEFFPKLEAILGRYPDLIYTIAGHVGDGNFHIIPLMDLRGERERALIPKLSDEVYRLVKEYGGSMSAEHNDGIIRTPYLSLMFGEDIVALFRQVKEIFDPDNIFNPGKKVGGTMEYALAHITPY